MTPITHFYNEWSWLSNFAASAITIDGKSYATVEHWYQSQKTFDPERQELIRMARNAGTAKKLGNDRKLTIVRDDWEEIKDSIMMIGLRLKFQDPWMRDHLIETGDREIIEGNTWHDQYWGDCNCKNRDGRHPKCLEVGTNRLGQFLMEIRKKLRNGEWDVQDLSENGAWTPDPTDVHTWFSLSYANYAVLHRTHLQSMPMEWQHRFTALMDELENTIEANGWPVHGNYSVQAKDDGGRFIVDPVPHYNRGRETLPIRTNAS